MICSMYPRELTYSSHFIFLQELIPMEISLLMIQIVQIIVPFIGRWINFYRSSEMSGATV